MRFTKLYVRTLMLAFLTLAASACQTAQKPVSLLPPGSAPTLHPATAPTQAPVSTSQPPAAQLDQAPQKPAEATTPPPPPAAPDHVADLIAQVERAYQAGLANYQAGKKEDAKQNFDNAL